MPPQRLTYEWLQWMNHELRTPLTSILGQLELLLGGEYGELSDEQREALEVIVRGGERLRLLAEQLRSSARA